MVADKQQSFGTLPATVTIAIRLSSDAGAGNATAFSAQIEGRPSIVHDGTALAEHLASVRRALTAAGASGECVAIILPQITTKLKHVAEAHRAAANAGLRRVAYGAALH